VQPGERACCDDDALAVADEFVGDDEVMSVRATLSDEVTDDVHATRVRFRKPGDGAVRAAHEGDPNTAGGDRVAEAVAFLGTAGKADGCEGDFNVANDDVDVVRAQVPDLNGSQRGTLTRQLDGSHMCEPHGWLLVDRNL
jgi:hypothetical protein